MEKEDHTFKCQKSLSAFCKCTHKYEVAKLSRLREVEEVARELFTRIKIIHKHCSSRIPSEFYPDALALLTGDLIARVEKVFRGGSSCSHSWARRRDGRWCTECQVIEFGKDIPRDEKVLGAKQ